MIAMILFELVLVHQGQNEYPGALTTLITMIAVVMFAASYQRKRD